MTNTLKVAFAGFRHGHMVGLYRMMKDHPETEIIAACEEHEDTREKLSSEITFTHDTIDQMIGKTECDAVAVGDYYAKRGQIIIKALENGKHVIADKPICTDLKELDRIAELSKTNNLAIGCQLDLRTQGCYTTLKKLVEAGEIGTVQTISFTGQHPLMYSSRPGWYFEEGKQGGTINDIAVHGIDCVLWLTGSPVAEILSARAWNTGFDEVPFFQNGAQCMLRLENGCGVLGDVSYITPDSFGYSLPFYWRITCHGTRGILETRQDHIALYREGEKEIRKISAEESTPNLYIDSFIQEIRGSCENISLTAMDILSASRVALLCQKAADEQIFGLKVQPWI